MWFAYFALGWGCGMAGAILGVVLVSDWFRNRRKR